MMGYRLCVIGKYSRSLCRQNLKYFVFGDLHNHKVINDDKVIMSSHTNRPELPLKHALHLPYEVQVLTWTFSSFSLEYHFITIHLYNKRRLVTHFEILDYYRHFDLNKAFVLNQALTKFFGRPKEFLQLQR